MGHFGTQGQCYRLDWWHSTQLQSLWRRRGMWWGSATTQVWAKMKSATLLSYISMETWNRGLMLPWTNTSICGPSMSILRWSFFPSATLAFKYKHSFLPLFASMPRPKLLSGKTASIIILSKTPLSHSVPRSLFPYCRCITLLFLM